MIYRNVFKVPKEMALDKEVAASEKWIRIMEQDMLLCSH